MVSSFCEINFWSYFWVLFEVFVEILLLDFCGILFGMEDGVIVEIDEGEGNVEVIVRNYVDYGFIMILGLVCCDWDFFGEVCLFLWFLFLCFF